MAPAARFLTIVTLGCLSWKLSSSFGLSIMLSYLGTYMYVWDVECQVLVAVSLVHVASG